MVTNTRTALTGSSSGLPTGTYRSQPAAGLKGMCGCVTQQVLDPATTNGQNGNPQWSYINTMSTLIASLGVGVARVNLLPANVGYNASYVAAILTGTPTVLTAQALAWTKAQLASLTAAGLGYTVEISDDRSLRTFITLMSSYWTSGVTKPVAVESINEESNFLSVADTPYGINGALYNSADWSGGTVINWSSSTAYTPGRLAISSSFLWICIKSNTNQQPPTAFPITAPQTYWVPYVSWVSLYYSSTVRALMTTAAAADPTWAAVAVADGSIENGLTANAKGVGYAAISLAASTFGFANCPTTNPAPFDISNIHDYTSAGTLASTATPLWNQQSPAVIANQAPLPLVVPAVPRQGQVMLGECGPDGGGGSQTADLFAGAAQFYLAGYVTGLFRLMMVYQFFSDGSSAYPYPNPSTNAEPNSSNYYGFAYMASGLTLPLSSPTIGVYGSGANFIKKRGWPILANILTYTADSGTPPASDLLAVMLAAPVSMAPPVVLKRSSGAYDIAVWQSGNPAASSWAAKTVTMTLGESFSSATAMDPYSGQSETATPAVVACTGSGASWSFTSPGNYPVIVRLSP